MSMHEIEGLVESSIRLLDKSPEGSSLDLRSVFWNLFRYQEKFDTGGTLFRAIDILIKNHYVYVFPVTEHPNYEKYKSYFDSLKEHSYILRNPIEEWDRENNPETGCEFCDIKEEWGEKFAQERGTTGPSLYIQAGLECWQKLVEQGKFTGKDAEPPKKMEMIDLATEIINIALKNNDTGLAAWWYKVGLPYEITWSDYEFASLSKDTRLLGLRKIAEENKLMEVDVYGYDEDSVADIDDGPNEETNKFLRWWFFLS